MNADKEICRMDALKLAARIRTKELSAIEVTEAVLRRMDVLEPHIHAFCTPTPEVARAEGNTTYRLVRRVCEDGHEEVLVSGRRTVAAGAVADPAAP